VSAWPAKTEVVEARVVRLGRARQSGVEVIDEIVVIHR
jgi:hypothetical protein